MPHFYRYRVEDDFEAKSRVQTPVAQSPAPPRRDVAEGAKAHVSLLGCEADLAIPPEGQGTNRMNLNILFTKLEKTMKELKDENKLLRQEVEKLKDRQHPQVLQVTGGASDNTQLEKKLTIRIENMEERLEDKAKADDQCISTFSGEIKSVASSYQILASDLAAHTSSTKAELVDIAKKLSCVNTHQVEALPSIVETQQDQELGTQDQDLVEQVEQLKLKVDSGISSMKDLVFAPLSVIFDAVRSEDWVGQDGWLPYTKLNINLGNGMNMDTGRFTVPISGVYFFLINVYGAPRDGVVLSIRANDFQEIASCSGVGKASQAVVVDLDKDDTVGVFVNDKSKLVDTDNNKFTHFLGMLLRPDTIRF